MRSGHWACAISTCRSRRTRCGGPFTNADCRRTAGLQARGPTRRRFVKTRRIRERTMDRQRTQPDSRAMFRRILIAIGVLILIVVGAFAAVIAFNAPTAPPVLAAGNSIPGIAQWNFAELPKPQTLTARDGAPINYRLYPGRPDRAVVLVHGSSGTDVSMLKLAQALQATGASVYAISLRGHGGSGTINGDVSYMGQLDDDLADVVKGLGLDKRSIHRTLIGFSAGGGFVLRVAG